MKPPRLATAAGCLTLAVLLVAGCDGTVPAPEPSSSATSTAPGASEPTRSDPPSESPMSTPSAEGLPTPQPGEPCDPAAGDPDCTDVGSSDGTFRLVVGYATCVEKFEDLTEQDPPGVCVDLDGDGQWGYPESG